MSDAPFFKCYPSDFLTGIAEMSPNEIAVYTVCIMRMYDEGGEIECDVERIARRCNMRPSAAKRAIDALLKTEKLRLTNGVLWKKRVKKEIESRQKVSKKSADAANARWKKVSEKPNENNAGPMQTHSPGNAKNMPTRNQKPEARSQIPPTGEARAARPGPGAGNSEATNSSDSPKRAEWRDALETACGVDLSKVTSPGDHRAFEAMVDAAIDSGLSRAFLTEQLAAARKAKGDQPRSPGPYWRKVLARIIADETGAGEDDDGPPPDPRREAAELRALRVKQFAETAATQPDWPWDEQRKGPRPSEAECAAAVAWDRSGPPPEIFFAYASKAEVGR